MNAFRNYLVYLFDTIHMIEVVYKYKGSYPFNKPVNQGTYFVEVLQDYSSQQEITFAKARCQQYKNLNCPYLMKLTNILKENKLLHLRYAYYPNSLQNYINKIQSQKDLIEIIVSIKEVINTLIKAQIKTDLYIENIAVDENGEIKCFIHPNYEKKQNKIELKEFYETQQKRIQIQIQQNYQKINGKKLNKSNPINLQIPNFVIKNNELVFTNSKENNIKSESFQQIQVENQMKKSIKQSNLSISPEKEKQFDNSLHKQDNCFSNSYQANAKIKINNSKDDSKTSPQNQKADRIHQKMEQIHRIKQDLLNNKSNTKNKHQNQKSVPNSPAIYEQTYDTSNMLSKLNDIDESDKFEQYIKNNPIEQESPSKKKVKMKITTYEEIEVSQEEYLRLKALENAKKLQQQQKLKKIKDKNNISQKVKQLKSKAQSALNQYTKNKHNK